jgi:hypothetical protein
VLRLADMGAVRIATLVSTPPLVGHRCSGTGANGSVRASPTFTPVSVCHSMHIPHNSALLDRGTNSSESPRLPLRGLSVPKTSSTLSDALLQLLRPPWDDLRPWVSA